MNIPDFLAGYFRPYENAKIALFKPKLTRAFLTQTLIITKTQTQTHILLKQVRSIQFPKLNQNLLKIPISLSAKAVLIES